jgi:3-dehydroquinate dehydratase
MRTLLAALFALATVGSIAVVPAHAAKPDKVGMCHEAHGHYEYIVVNPHALKHGHTAAKDDVLGLSEDECNALNAKA